jgi:hypothetical protein
MPVCWSSITCAETDETSAWNSWTVATALLATSDLDFSLELGFGFAA